MTRNQRRSSHVLRVLLIILIGLGLAPPSPALALRAGLEGRESTIAAGMEDRPPELSAPLNDRSPEAVLRLTDALGTILRAPLRVDSTIDFRAVDVAARQINPAFQWPISREALGRADTRQVQACLDALRWDVFLQAGYVARARPQSDGSYRVTLARIDERTWKASPYLGTTIWEAEFSWMRGPDQPGVSVGRWAWVDPQQAQRDSRQHFEDLRRSVLSRIEDRVTRRSLQRLQDLFRTPFGSQEIFDRYSLAAMRGEERRHAKDRAFAEQLFHRHFRFEPDQGILTVDAILKPSSPLWSQWSAARGSAQNATSLGAGIRELAAQLGGMLELAEEQPTLAALAAAHELYHQLSPRTAGGYQIAGRMFKEQTAKDVPRILQEFSHHNARTAALLALYKQVYERNFWTDAERPARLAGMEETPTAFMAPEAATHQGPVRVVMKIGGTTTAAQAATDEGFVGRRAVGPTLNKEPDEAKVVAGFVDVIAPIIDARGPNHIEGVEVAAPGWFDQEMRSAGPMENIAGLQRLGFSYHESIAAELARRYAGRRDPQLGPIRVRSVHDGTASGLLEVGPLGTFPGAGRLMIIDVGTGIAARMMIDGRPFLGDARIRYFHNEGPNLLMFTGDPTHPHYEYVGLRTGGLPPSMVGDTLPDGRSNRWLTTETLEQRTSGPGVARYAAQLARAVSATDAEATAWADDLTQRAGPDGLDALTSVHVSAAARAGNPLARRAIRNRMQELGIGLAVFIVESHLAFAEFGWPDHIVFGGGVAHAEPELFLDAIRDGFRRRLAQYDGEGVSYPVDLPDRLALSKHVEVDETARQMAALFPTPEELAAYQRRLQAAGLEEPVQQLVIVGTTEDSVALRLVSGIAGEMYPELRVTPITVLNNRGFRLGSTVVSGLPLAVQATDWPRTVALVLDEHKLSAGSSDVQTAWDILQEIFKTQAIPLSAGTSQGSADQSTVRQLIETAAVTPRRAAMYADWTRTPRQPEPQETVSAYLRRVCAAFYDDAVAQDAVRAAIRLTDGQDQLAGMSFSPSTMARAQAIGVAHWHEQILTRRGIDVQRELAATRLRGAAIIMLAAHPTLVVRFAVTGAGMEERPNLLFTTDDVRQVYSAASALNGDRLLTADDQPNTRAIIQGEFTIVRPGPNGRVRSIGASTCLLMAIYRPLQPGPALLAHMDPANALFSASYDAMVEKLLGTGIDLSQVVVGLIGASAIPRETLQAQLVETSPEVLDALEGQGASEELLQVVRQTLQAALQSRGVALPDDRIFVDLEPAIRDVALDANRGLVMNLQNLDLHSHDAKLAMTRTGLLLTLAPAARLKPLKFFDVESAGMEEQLTHSQQSRTGLEGQL